MDLTATQIVLLSIIGVCLLLSVVFMIMFIIEICRKPSEEATDENQGSQSVFTINNYEINVNENSDEGDVSEMLASLEEQTKDEVVEEVVEEPEVEEVVVEEVVEEPVTEEVEEVVEVEETEEPATEETVEVEAQDTAAEVEEVSEVAEEAKDDELISDIKEIESVGHGIVYSGNIIDYKNRLEKVIETRDNIERDLTKRQKAILKYERTKRRMNRNQKMLDRRAGELTNLNLLMYSVTDIKNVDEEKKAKQEDLTAHIAELKASIQDAEEYIESNKDKNENNIKMAKYLLNEKNRYNEEIAELENLIKSIEGTTTTVTDTEITVTDVTTDAE